MKNNSKTIRNNILSRLREFSIGYNEYRQHDFSVPKKKYSNEIKVKNFKANIEAAHAEVYSCSKNNWSNTLNLIIKKKKIKKMIYGKKTDLGQKIYSAFKNKSIFLPELFDYNKPVEEIKDILFGVDSSITNAKGGIAETGTIIIWPSPEEPRLMSLIPPIHIVLLNENKIFNNFLEAMNKEKWNTKMPTNLLLISGPSKTADIEQTIVYGVHGCKELIVLLIK